MQKISRIAHFSIKMFGIIRLNSFNQSIKMVLFILLQKIKGWMYFLIIMSKEMPGIIDLLCHTEVNNWLTYLEATKLLLSSYLNFFKRVNIGRLYGYPIHIIGQETNMISFLYGSLVLQADMTLLQSIVEWLWAQAMEHKEMVYQVMTIMQLCQLGLYSQA